MATCRSPLAAFELANGEVVFRERTGQNSVRSLFLPCGRCALCRRERSRQTAVRCVHETKLYDSNCFITLTYNDKNLPPGRTLHYPDFQDFMKRLRYHAAERVRFYMCGEYGGQTQRPHYHAILFNLDFNDKLYFKTIGDFKLYTSAFLAKLWPLGTHTIGSATFESAAYIARYCMDKITGDLAKKHYEHVDTETGEIFNRVPEFNRSSNRPGIGAPWLERFWTDVYPRGEVITNGRRAKSPRYYDKLFKRRATQDELDHFMQHRAELAKLQHAEDLTDERLAVREEVMIARLNLFKRSL